METTSRRTMLRRLSTIPPILALSSLTGCTRPVTRGTRGDTFVLYLEGPFSLVFYQGQPKIHIIAPSPAQHHEPSMTSDMAETTVKQSCDYDLVGLNPATPTPWNYPNVTRLSIPAAKLGMDKGGVIDKAKKRYFSLSVPVPDTIVPWHPVKMQVTGTHWPTHKEQLIPVGYIFIYPNADLPNIKANCLTDSTTWDPKLSLLPFQSAASIIVEMTSTLDSDPCHKVAIDSFGNERDLYQNVNTNTSLNLTVSYPSDPDCCPTCEKPIPPESESAKGFTPSNKTHFVTHTGADCKAGIIEITGVSNNVTLG